MQKKVFAKSIKISPEVFKYKYILFQNFKIQIFKYKYSIVQNVGRAKRSVHAFGREIFCEFTLHFNVLITFGWDNRDVYHQDKLSRIT